MTAHSADEHILFPPPNESPASFIANALQDYRDNLLLLTKLLQEGHPDPLSAPIGNCTCCEGLMDLGQSLEVQKAAILLAPNHFQGFETDALEEYHNVLLRYAAGDRESDCLVALRLLRRRAYVDGMRLWAKCASQLCPACRKNFDSHGRRAAARIPAGLMEPPGSRENQSGTHPEHQPANAIPDLVTLDQAAAAVHMSKRSLERRKSDGTLPEPLVEGGGGKSARYDWKVMRPWLEKTFGMKLPDRFPGNLR